MNEQVYNYFKLLLGKVINTAKTVKSLEERIESLEVEISQHQEDLATLGLMFEKVLTEFSEDEEG